MAITALAQHVPVRSHESVNNADRLLRILTCGSVDNGKSSLIGRLLCDSERNFDDELTSPEKEPHKFSVHVGDMGSECELGITDDVAHHYFATDKREFIIAGMSGHEQDMRNMATGASTADIAIVLVDARHGVVPQTRRHSFVISLMGVRHVVLAINKMDLVKYSEAQFRSLVNDYRHASTDLKFETLTPIPTSALRGDNIIALSAETPWYSGPSLLQHLESITPDARSTSQPFRLPVQWVDRSPREIRSYAGTIASGTVCIGDSVLNATTGQITRVARIIAPDGDTDQAGVGDTVNLITEDQIDITPGDVVSSVTNRPETTDQFAGHLIWMSDEALLPGRPYLLKSGTKTVTAQITELKHKTDLNTFEHLAAKTLDINEIGFCNVALSEPIAFDAYTDNRHTGSFILLDRFSKAAVAAGTLSFGLRRATNIHPQTLTVTKPERASQKGQKPAVLWFTGLSGSGKSTIANLIEQKLHADGYHTYLLDGDNVRHGLNRDLGFTDADRVENIRRIAELAKLFVDAGILTLVSFISPFVSERHLARTAVDENEFIEIFVDTPIEICQQRDPKGLYARAIKGEIRNFTGIDSPYEAPENPDIHIDTTIASAEAAAQVILRYLREREFLGT